MPASKLYLHGNCQEPGCTKRALHLRGSMEHRVMGDSLIIKALCGEHTRAWDARKQKFIKDLPPSDPRHMFPSSVIAADEVLAEKLAAEQEAWELAKRLHHRLPPTPEWDRIEARRARQPAVVRLN